MLPSSGECSLTCSLVTHYCLGCHASLDDVPLAETCPSCGRDQGRGAWQQGIAAAAAAAVGSASIQVNHPRQKDWERKWLEVELQLRKLED
jgi:hypothetical protein